jgi:hypothetical protein
MTPELTTLVWLLVVIIVVLVVMNLVLMLMTRRNHNKEIVPDTLPQLTFPEISLKEKLQNDIDANKGQMLAIRLKAKAMEEEYIGLKASIKELESMRGDVV